MSDKNIGENFSGEVVQEIDNGKVVMNFLNGKKEGVTKFISSTGIVLSEINYGGDEINGDVKQYYPSGNILSIMEYSNGKPHGSFSSFFENGMKQVSSQYQMGEIHGNFKAFDEFGDPLIECVYLKGQKHGKNLLYYPKSQGGGIYELSFFENGLLNGDKVTFYQTGEVMSVTPYCAGKAQVYTKNYSKAGTEI